MLKKNYILFGFVFLLSCAFLLFFILSRKEQGSPPISLIIPEKIVEKNKEEYVDATRKFSLMYPKGYTQDKTYVYQNLGPEKNVPGVKFTIPESKKGGTNLSDDTYISVEYLDGESCSAELFLPSGAKASWENKEGEGLYSIASLEEAGAGNRYEEHVYALLNSKPCIAIRYFVHYSVIENYDPGTISSFDKTSLLKEFDEIRKSLTFRK